MLGDVKTSSLQLGELLENDLLGPLSLNVHVNGELSSEHLTPKCRARSCDWGSTDTITIRSV